MENSKQRFGRRPTEVAYDAGILGRNCIAAHCVWLSDAEIALMRETGTQISHNPSSNAKLGNGIARLPEILGAGINVGIGHDAAECNNSRDLFEVMKFASLMHRASRVDASLQQAPDVVRMATRNGADALGHETGLLAPGRKADVILVNLKSQMFTPLMPGNADHLFSHLVFAANGSCVDTTIIDGKIVMEDRRADHGGRAEGPAGGERRVPAGAGPDGRPAVGVAGWPGSWCWATRSSRSAPRPSSRTAAWLSRTRRSWPPGRGRRWRPWAPSNGSSGHPGISSCPGS